MQQSESDAFGPRSIGEFRLDLKAFMKNSKEDDPQLERNAIFNLCQLHFEITFDSRFETNQRLQGMRAVIAKRLEKYSKDQKNVNLRKQRQDKASGNQASDSGEAQSSDDAATSNELTQSSSGDSDSAGVGSGGDTVSSYSGESDSESESDSGDAMYDSASESYYTIGSLSGGPNQLFGYAGGRFDPPWDHGEDLVDLITTVINPTFWRRNGGVGSIHYYRPSMVLVIRATQQGNEEVGDLLEKLRANAGTQLNIGGVGNAIGN